MKLTKEDYMRLPKERLAELLVEKEETITSPSEPIVIPQSPSIPYVPPWNPVPWWSPYYTITTTTNDSNKDE